MVLCIRPEHVTLTLQSSYEVTSPKNVLVGRIEKTISLGLYQEVELDCGFPLVTYVTQHSMEKVSLRKSIVLKASFKATAIYIMKGKRE